jgi:LacI family fructose operon transcriptional repressor
MGIKQDEMGKELKRTTIYDLAILAEASPSAVSSVLNGTWQKRRISKKLASRVMRLAEEHSYAVNVQARLLKRESSNIIGMIVPKFDNRYFGEIAEKMEIMARAKGLFPVVTCTQRDPDLEFEAAKELVSYQAEWLISTGATEPDRISAFCKASSVRSINLDLPGNDAPSVVSDNYTGARDLCNLILDRCEIDLASNEPLRFVGGRLSDHNTAARLEGFMAAHDERGIKVPDRHIKATGYSAAKAFMALDGVEPKSPTGLFVNSTISLEGVVRWYNQLGSRAVQVRYGCFDWDPFGSFLPGNVGMIEQDVDTMLAKVFELMSEPSGSMEKFLIPCNLRVF